MRRTFEIHYPPIFIAFDCRPRVEEIAVKILRAAPGKARETPGETAEDRVGDERQREIAIPSAPQERGQVQVIQVFVERTSAGEIGGERGILRCMLRRFG